MKSIDDIDFLLMSKNAIHSITNLQVMVDIWSKIAGYLALTDSGLSIPEVALAVRKYLGTPDWREKGDARVAIDLLTLFGSIGMESFFSDTGLALTSPKTALGYAWQTAKQSWLPKFLQWLLSAGVLVILARQLKQERLARTLEKIQRMYQKIPEFYLTTSQFCLPFKELGKKVLWARMPTDPVAQLSGALFWKGLNLFDPQKRDDVLTDMLALYADQLPNVGPFVNQIAGFGSLFTALATKGKVAPIDISRLKQIATNEEIAMSFKAEVGFFEGSKYWGPPVLRWFLGTFGIRSFHQEADSPLERFIKYTPVLARFLKVTDYGRKEQDDAERRRIETAPRKVAKTRHYKNERMPRKTEGLFPFLAEFIDLTINPKK